MKTVLYVEANPDAVKARWRKLMDENLGDIREFSESRRLVETWDTEYMVKSVNDSWRTYCGLRYNEVFIDEYADITEEKLHNIKCRIMPMGDKVSKS